MKIPAFKIKINERPFVVLSFLIVVDVIFIIGHIITTLFWEFKHGAFLLDARGFSYPESYQCLKYFAIIGLTGYLHYFKKGNAYLVLSILFVFFMLEDLLQLHLGASMYVVDLFSLYPFLKDASFLVGQLIYSVFISLFFFTLFLWCYLQRPKSIKRLFDDISLFLGLFLFFGVGVDALNRLFGVRQNMEFILTIIEEGGEMMCLSLLAWCFYSMILLQGDHESFPRLVLGKKKEVKKLMR